VRRKKREEKGGESVRNRLFYRFCKFEKREKREKRGPAATNDGDASRHCVSSEKGKEERKEKIGALCVNILNSLE